MNKIIKNIIKFLLFISILSFTLFKVNQILLVKHVEDGHYSPVSQYEGFYQMDKNSIDVLFLGSSHSYYAFSTQELYNQFNIRSYNLGSSLQDIWVSYYWLKEALRFQTPKAVVLETYYIFGDSDEPCIRKALDYMKWSKVKNEAVMKAKQEYPELTPMSFYFPNIRFHERWKELKEIDFSYEALAEHYEMKGNLIRGQKYGKENYQTLPAEIKDSDEIPEDVQLYLNKIVTLCNDNDIDLVFVKTPSLNWSITQHNAVHNFAENHGITFYDLNEKDLYANLEYNFAEDNRDEGHANIWGAEKITKVIGSILQNVHDIEGVEDHQWETTKDYFENIKKDCTLPHETDINKYLSMLADTRYTIFISIKDEATENLTAEITQSLNNLGLKTDLTGKYRNSYFAIVSPNGIQEEISEAKLEAEGMLRNGLSNYSIVSAGYKCGNVSSIKIDGVEYSVNSRGLNIVVYNNESHRVIDTVCFDTCKDLTATRK